MEMLEDNHIQIDLGDHKELLDYDLIMRVNDDGTKYTGFDICHYITRTIIAHVPFK
jgi:hypothetical protein